MRSNGRYCLRNWSPISSLKQRDSTARSSINCEDRIYSELYIINISRALNHNQAVTQAVMQDWPQRSSRPKLDPHWMAGANDYCCLAARGKGFVAATCRASYWCDSLRASTVPPTMNRGLEKGRNSDYCEIFASNMVSNSPDD